MSWKESDIVSERAEFVLQSKQGILGMTELCSRFGVSRKTGYKWLKREREFGSEGLQDLSRRPHLSPNQSSAEFESLVVELRHKHPCWGGRKLKQVLENRGYQDVPSPSTITRILHRHDLINPLESAKRQAFQRFEHSSPNDLWQIDFKGDFKLTNGSRCYPLTILDDHSRYSLCIEACDNERRATVKEHFRTVFQKYGIPKAIYADNGNPWGNSQSPTRHSRFSMWLMRLDIEVIHGKPYHPQGRGKIERFHRTLKLEVLQDRQFSNHLEAQAAFDPWREIYNFSRPHDSLEMQVPADRYVPSGRSFQEWSEPFEYSSVFHTRRTNRVGQFSFQGKAYRISEVYQDQAIGLRPTKTDGIWDIYFCRFPVAELNQHTGQIIYASRLTDSRFARDSQTAGSADKPPKGR